MKSRNIFVTTTDFINAADLTREDFRKGIKTIHPLCEKLTVNNHKAIIYSLIERIQEKLDLPDAFGNISRGFFNRFSPLLNNTKPEITAGVVCILSLLKLKIQSVSILTICKTLGFQVSAAFYQVKNNILKRAGIPEESYLNKNTSAPDPGLPPWLLCPVINTFPEPSTATPRPISVANPPHVFSH
ncbi:hypothetical protein LCGC14_1228590 [marine sediment metagenome]|uniref:Uncharacterized protein n=1 Tax=marine sediment metagenome TaxID=412755 RepID=A0A0F9L946_9ZZZZ